MDPDLAQTLVAPQHLKYSPLAAPRSLADFDAERGKSFASTLLLMRYLSCHVKRKDTNPEKS